MAADELRRRCRRGEWTTHTAGQALGCAQANLVVLRLEDAYDFLLFCQRNPKPCPLLEVTDVGDPRVKELASDCDVRTDVPLYRIFRRGALEAEVTDISEHWTSDMVAFLLGCSFSFEAALAERGIPLRHVEEGRNVPMYRTSVACKPAGRFSGRLVVSMRPMTPGQAIEAVRITSAFPRVHGSPVHFGDPSLIGISDIYKPDYGDAVTIKEGESVLLESKPELAITHAPGCMLVLDATNAELAER